MQLVKRHYSKNSTRTTLFTTPAPLRPHPDQVDRINKLPDRVKPHYCTEVMRQCTKKGLTENPQSFGPNAVGAKMGVQAAVCKKLGSSSLFSTDFVRKLCHRSLPTSSFPNDSEFLLVTAETRIIVDAARLVYRWREG